ncbi:MAG: phosphotransferase [Halovenus sp.]
MGLALGDDERLPTPFYLMRALPGEELAYERVSRLEDDVLGRVARDIGRYLGELHSVPAVERFGHVRHDGPELAGGRPGGDPATLSVGNPRDTWQEFLRAYADRELDRHADSPRAAQPARRPGRRGDRDARLGVHACRAGRLRRRVRRLPLQRGVSGWAARRPGPAPARPRGTILSDGSHDILLVPRGASESINSSVRQYNVGLPERADALASPEPLYEALAMVRVMDYFEHLSTPDGSEGVVMDRIEADARELLAEGR